ncbi:DUF6069 family protein [Actinoplanes sp. KI2]|uniref:DUF6069 family protein n=1 Tax=Actinoplanes sp. KI2 TaxID=2983315 RepID=UPI0021D595AB|nr:DUF6069 family protein [Actinoplanes sp. KI2]MCU7724236.1 DUF6069 family protein [Actinoplanes sp. KI2]
MSRRTALILLAVIACAIAVNTLVAAVARHAGASATFPPLQLPVYGAFTAAGVLAGWAGWQLVRRRSARPRRVLKVLVPTVAVLSFLPDVALLTLKFIPDTTATAVAALMVMHVVVVAFAVPGYQLAAPVNAPDGGAVAAQQPVGNSLP